MLIVDSIQKPTWVQKAISGSFSAPNQIEFVLCRNNTLELYSFDAELDELTLTSRTPVYSVIRDIVSYNLPETETDVISLGTDSGRFTVYAYDAAAGEFKCRASHPYGRTGCRRTVPGQFIAAQPSGDMVMVAAVEEAKVFYHVSADEQYTLSAVQASNRPRTLTYDVAALETAPGQPALFAAIEATYEDPAKRLVIYSTSPGQQAPEVHMRMDPLPPTAHRIVPLPATDVVGACLVCCEDEVLYLEEYSADPVQCFIPRRDVFKPASPAFESQSTGTIITGAVGQKMRATGEAFMLIQTEHGDVFRVAVGPSLTVSFVRTLPVAASMAFNRGRLLLAAESGPHGMFLVQPGSQADDSAAQPDVRCSSGEPCPTISWAGPKTVPQFYLDPIDVTLPSLGPLIRAVPLESSGSSVLMQLVGHRHHSRLVVSKRGVESTSEVSIAIEGMSPTERIADIWAVSTSAPTTAAEDDIDDLVVLSVSKAVGDSLVYRTIFYRLVFVEDEDENVSLSFSHADAGWVEEMGLSTAHTVLVHSYRTEGHTFIAQVTEAAVCTLDIAPNPEDEEAPLITRGCLTTAAVAGGTAITQAAGHAGRVTLVFGDTVLASVAMENGFSIVQTALPVQISTITCVSLDSAGLIIGSFGSAEIFAVHSSGTLRHICRLRTPGRVDSVIRHGSSLFVATSAQVASVRQFMIEADGSASEQSTALVAARRPFQLKRLGSAVLAGSDRLYHVGMGGGLLDVREVICPVAHCVGAVNIEGKPMMLRGSAGLTLLSLKTHDYFVPLAELPVNLTPRFAVPLGQPVETPDKSTIITMAVVEADQRVAPTADKDLAEHGYRPAVDGVGLTRLRLIRVGIRFGISATIETISIVDLTDMGMAVTAATVVGQHLVLAASRATGPWLGRNGRENAAKATGELMLFDFNGRKLSMVETAAPPRSLAPFSEGVLVSVGHSLVHYQVRGGRLLRAAVSPPLPGPLGTVLADGDVRVWAATGRGWCVLSFDSIDSTFTVVAQEQSVRYPIAGVIVDRDSVLAADRFGTLYLVTVPAFTASKLRTGAEVVSTTGHDVVEPDLLHLTHSTNIHDSVTSFCPVIVGKRCSFLFSTLCGQIGWVHPIKTESDANVLHAIQAGLQTTYTESYRSSFFPALNCVDFDLVKSAARLTGDDWETIGLGRHEQTRAVTRGEALRLIQNLALEVI
ncbi:CPSF A subunit region [Carpediemonas membranifera]|uniref:CPSF A subunit region n=1 Tax=Carpediemonas membranifera TaxID=201153 RepID=A0A8J6E145_9EUKA|nr:CPSF A subunit region [Carpediemonas membranifera]|eukprot:KAG9390157.1 CPSF A subunit region [Carpediemonas membranifera]